MATAIYTSETILESAFVDDAWQDETSPGVGGQRVVVHSTGQANPSKNSIEAIVQYEAMAYEAPGGGTPIGGNQGFSLIAVVEQEVADGVWVPVACQLQGISRAVKGDQATKQIIKLAPFTANSNQRTTVQAGQEVIDYCPVDGRAKPSTDYRICLVMKRTDETRDQLSSITFSAWMEFYDT